MHVFIYYYMHYARNARTADVQDTPHSIDVNFDKRNEYIVALRSGHAACTCAIITEGRLKLSSFSARCREVRSSALDNRRLYYRQPERHFERSSVSVLWENSDQFTIWYTIVPKQSLLLTHAQLTKWPIAAKKSKLTSAQKNGTTARLKMTKDKGLSINRRFIHN